MKARSWLVGCCLMLLSTLPMRAAPADGSPQGAGSAGRRRGGAPGPPLRRRALRRGRARPSRLLRPEPGRPGGKRTRVRRLPHGDGPFPALARQRRGEVPAPPSGGAIGIRTPTIRCSGRSTRTTSGPTARAPATSATCARTAWSGSPFRCRRTSGSIDPATNAPSTETFVDVWRIVPTVNDVALTGPDDVNPWPRGPNASGGYQLDARVATLQEQALGALTNHAQIQERAAAAAARRPGVVPAGAVHEPPCARAVRRRPRRARPRCRIPIRRSTSSSSRARSSSSAPARQCHGGPGTVDRTGPGRSLPRHRDAVSASRRHRDARPLRLCAVPAATRAQCPDLRDHAGRTARKIRRTSSDPGRALLTGFVGGPAPQDDWNKFDMPGLRGISQTAPVLPQQQRRHARRGRRPLHRVLQARAGECAAGCRAADPDHRRRALRSAADSRRARGAPGVPAEAVDRLRGSAVAAAVGLRGSAARPATVACPGDARMTARSLC